MNTCLEIMSWKNKYCAADYTYLCYIITQNITKYLGWSILLGDDVLMIALAVFSACWYRGKANIDQLRLILCISYKIDRSYSFHFIFQYLNILNKLDYRYCIRNIKLYYSSAVRTCWLYTPRNKRYRRENSSAVTSTRIDVRVIVAGGIGVQRIIDFSKSTLPTYYKQRPRVVFCKKNHELRVGTYMYLFYGII